MKIVHINNYDIKGGAARAAFSLNSALNKIGVNSEMLVQNKLSSGNNIFSISDSYWSKKLSELRYILDTVQMKIIAKSEKGKFSVSTFGVDITKHNILKTADIIHLHWINGGYLSLSSFRELAKLRKPIVWTLHDMWAFTGGCHYSAGCEKYKKKCGICPAVKKPKENDQSSILFRKKNDLYKELDLTIVTCTKWLAELAKKSSLLSQFKVIPIANTLNLNKFKPTDKKIARSKLNLPQDKTLILFGTMSTTDKRKGLNYLIEALNILLVKNPYLYDKLELIVFGRSDNVKFSSSLKINELGRLSNDEEIVLAYCAADFSVVPSIEDNLPNTVLESLACGVPVTAFNIGGMPEMIDHKKNGYLANEITSDSLSKGLEWMIKNISRTNKLSKNSYDKIQNNYTNEIIGNLYKKIYLEILDKKKIT